METDNLKEEESMLNEFVEIIALEDIIKSKDEFRTIIFGRCLEDRKEGIGEIISKYHLLEHSGTIFIPTISYTPSRDNKIYDGDVFCNPNKFWRDEKKYTGSLWVVGSIHSKTPFGFKGNVDMNNEPWHIEVSMRPVKYLPFKLVVGFYKERENEIRERNRE